MWQILPEPKILEAIGERVRALRLARGMTQDALATHAGISLPTMQRLEAGQGQPKAESLIRVLRSLRKLDELEAMLAPPSASPMALATNTKPPRQRAPRKATTK